MTNNANLWADAKRVLVNVGGFSSDHGIRIARNRKKKLVGCQGTMPVVGAEVGKQADSWRDVQLGRGFQPLRSAGSKPESFVSRKCEAGEHLGSRRVLYRNGEQE
jgi:hypothetical protein